MTFIDFFVKTDCGYSPCRIYKYRSDYNEPPKSTITIKLSDNRIIKANDIWVDDYTEWSTINVNSLTGEPVNVEEDKIDEIYVF